MKNKKQKGEDLETQDVFHPEKVWPVKTMAEWKSTRVEMKINKFKDGNTYLDIRQYYHKRDDPETFFPTGKGLSVHMHHLLDLEKGVKKAVRMAEKRGLLEDQEDEA